jgi:integrase
MGWIRGAAGAWEGGRIWEDKDGRRTYVVRRQIGGRRYEVSTRCSRLRSALTQLERFEANPDGYDPGVPAGEALRLSAELAKLYLAWSAAPEREGGKGNGRGWVLQQRAYLAWWASQLKARDLRALSLRDHIIPALDGVPGRRHRVEVLKAFFSWLRRERHLVSRAEDVTLDLLVPARRPEQWRRPKAIPRAHYLRALAALAPTHRDALTLLDETGWHVSELVRFVRDGSLEAMPPGRVDAAAVIICPQRKSGEMQRTAIGPEAQAAAQRLRDKGTFSVGRFYEAVRAACEKTGIEPFTPGRCRHTLATRAIEAGADPAAVSAYLGHKSAATTRRFYATLAVPPRVKR